MSQSHQYPALSESTYYILLSLSIPMHGYGIMQNVKMLTNERLNLAPGTLYGAISSLLDKDLISPLPPDEDKRKKEYILTSTGQKALQSEIKRLEELYYNGLKMVKGDRHND